MLKQRYSLCKLRDLMDELCDARYSGADAIRISRAQGLADGYMRALSDLGVVTQQQLLELIDEEQQRVAQRADERLLASIPLEAVPNMA